MIVMLALFLSLNATAGEGFDKLYSKYSASEDVTSINLSESMISIASRFIGENDQDAKDLLASVKGLKVLISETPNSQLSSEAFSIARSGGYEELIRVNDGDDKVRIMVQEKGDLIQDVLVLVESDDEFVFINLTGNIDPNQVGKVLKTLDIDVEGLEIH